MRHLLIILSLIFTLGCVATSESPLTGPGNEKMDSSILGTWFWQEENELGYIHIGLDREPRLLRIMMLDFDRNGELEVSEFSGHTSFLEGNSYLNVKWIRPAGENDGYLFLKYRVTEEKLGISLMDVDVVEEAIKAGSLKGVLKSRDGSSCVRITEGQKKLQQFVLRNDEQLFNEMKYLHKLKLTNIQSKQKP